jgi:hypothetical protein
MDAEQPVFEVSEENAADGYDVDAWMLPDILSICNSKLSNVIETGALITAVS